MNTSALDAIAGTTPLYPPQVNDAANQAIKQFAVDNGLAYAMREPRLTAHSWRDYKYTPAWLGAVGLTAGKIAYHTVSGTYRGYPMWMFSMYDTLTDGYSYRNPTEEQRRAYTAQQTTGIVRVRLPKVFPQVVLDSIKNDGRMSTLGGNYNRSQLLSLEGNFNEYFDLYAPVGLHVNVLTLLAPNAMEILKDYAGTFDMEFYGNEMIIITKAALYDPETMTVLDELLNEQLSYLTRLIRSWNYTPAKPPFDILKKTFIQGRAMRIGRFRLSAGLFLSIIAGFFVLVFTLQAFSSVLAYAENLIFILFFVFFGALWAVLYTAEHYKK